MSALINSLSKPHTRQNSTVNETPQIGDVSAISVITRIDYNLRFTKQAVLVISAEQEQYSKLANQYLVNLSNSSHGNDLEQINIAYLSASTKLNDLQIRCRLVEQLFVNSLFDPEQSLAVSVLQFAKLQGEAISIVIEHGQTLSLQIKYELCQLVNQAKKQNITINVVIFGLTEAAQQVSVNRSLFKGKMALIDAATGQIINLNDAKIQPQRLKRKLSKVKVFGLIALLLIVALAGFWLYKVAFINFENLSNESSIKVDSTVLPLNSNQKVNQQKVTIEAIENKKEPNSGNYGVSTASGYEISNAILAKPTKPIIKAVEAKPADIITALTLATDGNSIQETEDYVEQSDTVITQVITQVITDTDNSKITNISPMKPTYGAVNKHYYQNQAVVHDKGYVIQIAGFYDQRLWAKFIAENQSQALYSYQRMLNNSKFYVVTSPVFDTKEGAKHTLSLLPENLINRKPWVKDISSVIKEINTLK